MIYAVVKRLLDLSIAAIGLIVASPVVVYLVFAVRRDGGPALYRASRVGKNGNHFTMLKFRTMVVDADQIGGASTATLDTRITPLGHRMRARKWDELPQFLNVLNGSMSLVGPRPWVDEDVAVFTNEQRALILSVSPGITDWSSIKYRNEGEITQRAVEEGTPNADEAYNRLIRPGKIALAAEYARRRSLIVDLRIMVLTLVALFNHDAAVKRVPVVW